MKYFLIIIFIMFIIEEIFEFFYKRTESYKNSLNGAYSLKKIPKNIKVLNIGSGPGLYDLTYENFSVRGMNFSTAPQSVEYSYAILKKISPKVENGAVVIIFVLPFSFCKNNDYDTKNYSDKFYGLLQAKEIKNFSFFRYVLLQHPFFVRGIKKTKSYFIRNNYEDIKSEKSISSVWLREFNLYDFQNFKQLDIHKPTMVYKQSIYEELINYCYNKNWNPLIIIPPIKSNILEAFSFDFLKTSLYENLDRLSVKFPNLIIFDCLKNGNFTDEYFKNDVFLNEHGRVLFSDSVRDFITKQYNISF